MDYYTWTQNAGWPAKSYILWTLHTVNKSYKLTERERERERERGESVPSARLDDDKKDPWINTSPPNLVYEFLASLV